MIVQTPEIIFLKSRGWSFKKLHRVILSKLIYLLSGKYVHCALIYRKNNVQYVREMDFNGVRKCTLLEYISKYKNRIERVKLNNPVFHYKIKDYNKWCLENEAKYEYKNLFGWQLIKSIFGYWIGFNSKARRICSEDSARGLNILYPGFIKYPDMFTPSELYEFIKHKL